MSEHLIDLARYASRVPTLFGHRLAAYQLDRGLSDMGLCRLLGTDEVGLARLRLCGIPRPGTDGATIIARYLGLNAAIIQEIVNQTEDAANGTA